MSYKGLDFLKKRDSELEKICSCKDKHSDSQSVISENSLSSFDSFDTNDSDLITKEKRRHNYYKKKPKKKEKNYSKKPSKSLDFLK